MTDKDGGSAYPPPFPTVAEAFGKSQDSASGMSVRQYYKAQAIVGLAALWLKWDCEAESTPDELDRQAEGQDSTLPHCRDISKAAGFIADAMIREDQEFAGKNNQKRVAEGFDPHALKHQGEEQ